MNVEKDEFLIGGNTAMMTMRRRPRRQGVPDIAARCREELWTPLFCTARVEMFSKQQPRELCNSKHYLYNKMFAAP